MTAAPSTSVDAPRAAGPVGRLRWHALLMALVLAAGFAFVDPSVPFSADEGAVIAQVRAIADGGWTIEHPLPAVDPDGRWFPLEASVRTDDGFAPYSKHPAYPVVLLPLDAAAGTPAMVALSTLATLAAALVGAAIARRLAPGTEIVTLWIVGVGSPLLFNGYLVIAHTSGAALAGLTALFVIVALDDGTRRPALWAVAAALSGAAAVLLRSEAVLLGVALALCVLAVREHEPRRRIAVAASVTAGTFGAYLADARLSQAVLGAPGVDPFTISSDAGFLSGRMSGLSITWLQPTLNAALGAGGVLLLVGMILWVVVGMELRRDRTDDGPLTVVALAIAVLALVRLIAEPTMVVPGLLPAFPVLGASFVVMGWARLRGSSAVLFGTFCLFSLAVLATQYSNGGSSQWGGRYFVLGLPLVIPVAVAVITRALASRSLRAQRVLWAAASVTMVALSLTSVLGMRDVHGSTADVLDFVAREAIAAGGDDPVVIATRAAIPRVAHEQLDDARWLLVPLEEVPEALARLADEHVVNVSVIDDQGDLDAIEELDSYRVVGGSRLGGTEVRRLALAEASD